MQILCIYADLVVSEKAENASTFVCDDEDRGSVRCQHLLVKREEREVGRTSRQTSMW